MTFRVALSLFAVMASLLFALPAPCTWDNGPALHTHGLDFRLVGVWQHWDACWYMKIATLGYRPGDASVAFFPLYPSLMRLAGIGLAGNVTLAGLVVSGVAYVAGMVGLYKLVEYDFDAALAQRTMLYVSAFPTAFFFFAPFSEALFLALVVWTLYLARRGRWDWAAVVAFLAGLARLQGCLLALPLVWEAFRQWRSRSPVAGRRAPPDLSAALAWLPPVTAIVGFIAYSKAFTGWTTFQAQQEWGQSLRAPWTAVALSWTHIRANGDVVEALNLSLLVLFVGLLIAGLSKVPLLYTFYAVPQLLVAAAHQAFFSPLMSTSRFVLVLFPAFVVLALLGRRRTLHESWLALSLLMLGFFLYAFLSGPFVG